jgi:hypothetical protein
MRMGWFRPVHCKSPGSQEVRALLVGRKLLLSKLLDVEFSIRGILRGFGLKMGMVTRKSFEARVRELCAGQSMLEQICMAMLGARSALQTEYTRLQKAMLTIVRGDEVCRRLMTTPRVGPLVAITFKTGVDTPARIRKSKAIGALFGLTPRKYQSGETDVTVALHASATKRCARRSMRRPISCCRRHAVLGAQALGNGGRQAARDETGQGRPGAQDRRDPASDVGRCHKCLLDEGGGAESPATYPGLNRQGTRFRSEPDQARFVRSPVAGTMEPVKPQDGQWPSSDGSRVIR